MSLKGLIEGKPAFFKRKDRVGTAEFDAIFGRDAVDGPGVELKSSERSQELARRRIAGRSYSRKEKKQSKENQAGPHRRRSVVTFGMRGQGRVSQESFGA